MDAPFLPGTKWFNYCHQLTGLTSTDFEKRISNALDTLNAKVCSVYAEYRKNPSSFDRGFLLIKGKMGSSQPECAAKVERLVAYMKEMERNPATQTAKVDELNARIKETTSLEGPFHANQLFQWVLDNFNELAPYIAHSQACRNELTQLMDRSVGEIKSERQHGGFGPNLRRLARKLNQVAPGSIKEVIAKYDERTFSIKAGDTVIQVSSLILEQLKKDCKNLQPEMALPGSINKQAFKHMLHRYQPTVYRARNVDQSDMIRLGLILGNKTLTDNYLSDLLWGLFASFNEEDPVRAKEYFDQYLLLRKLAAETQSPYIQGKIDKLENDVRDVSRSAVLTSDFSLYVKHELPESTARKLIEAINIVIEKEKYNRSVMSFSALADRAIKTLQIWLQLSNRLHLEICSENPVAKLIEEVLLNTHRKDEIPSKMKQLKEAFPEFMVKPKEAVTGDDDFCEFSKEEAKSLPLKLDLSEIEEFKTDELQHLYGLNITEIKFYEQTPAVKILMNLLPLAKFTFVVEPPPEKEPSDFEKGFKRFLSGF